MTDYAAVVNAFRTGDVDMAWFGGLTGVQARLQVDGAQAILQRDIDEKFRSVFIANVSTGIQPFEDISGLQALKGRTFTFGSESSTSGRLMPQFFMRQAGLSLSDLRGEPGFSGSHDKTIKLVEAGSYEVGALNEQVWEARVKGGEVDTSKVIVIWRTPPYYDYHWVVRPDVEQKFGRRLHRAHQAGVYGARRDQPSPQRNPRPLRRAEVHRDEERELRRYRGDRPRDREDQVAR